MGPYFVRNLFILPTAHSRNVHTELNGIRDIDEAEEIKEAIRSIEGVAPQGSRACEYPRGHLDLDVLVRRDEWEEFGLRCKTVLEQWGTRDVEYNRVQLIAVVHPYGYQIPPRGN